ncbi:hypothetical protein [Enterococcus faecalis]|uniref:hypothetical protein n=1 Tax=Enterococcus faecalis TaxID=1351 RepID=UPI0018E174E9|nr:hypothetical protein [Enterococcus faecalis]MBI0605325.1 hypothetical protein [Enterococcus faecalis]
MKSNLKIFNGTLLIGLLMFVFGTLVHTQPVLKIFDISLIGGLLTLLSLEIIIQELESKMQIIVSTMVILLGLILIVFSEFKVNIGWNFFMLGIAFILTGIYFVFKNKFKS